MHTRLLIGIATLLVACVVASENASPNSSRPQQATPVLKKIQVTGFKRFSSERIVVASGLAVGQPFDRNALNGAVNRLGDTGAFEYVRYNFRPLEGGVAVELVLKESDRFHKCVFNNFIWFSEKDLRDLLQKHLPLYDGYAPESGNMADAINEVVEKILKSKGIPSTVSRTVHGALGDPHWVYEFNADGVTETVAAVNFEGAATVDGAALQKEAAPLVKRNFTVTDFRIFGEKTFVPFYRERGYLQIKVGDPTARPTNADSCLVACEVTVTFPVTEGLIYRWNAATWSGDLIASASDLERIFGMKPSEVANGNKIDDGFGAVRKEYSGKGYIEARVKSVPAFDDATKTVTYSVDVEKGAQYRMGEVQFTGFPSGFTEKLKNKWRCKTGDVYDGNYLDEFMHEELRNMIRENRVQIRKLETRPTVNKVTRTVDIVLAAS